MNLRFISQFKILTISVKSIANILRQAFEFKKHIAVYLCTTLSLLWICSAIAVSFGAYLL